MIWLKQFWGNALCCGIGPNHALFDARNIDKDKVHVRTLYNGGIYKPTTNSRADFEGDHIDGVRDPNASMISERMKWRSPRKKNTRRPNGCQNYELYPNVAVCGTIGEQVGPDKAKGSYTFIWMEPKPRITPTLGAKRRNFFCK
ncbi:hypothetical protein GQ457_07G010090 [Hibiscus cannabinus]